VENVNYNERKKYREVLLKSVYQHYFMNNGNPLGVSYDEYHDNIEKKLAYDYLVEKGLLQLSTQGRTKLYKPTVFGIDYVESLE